jgi:hypothetical protein
MFTFTWIINSPAGRRQIARFLIAFSLLWTWSYPRLAIAPEALPAQDLTFPQFYHPPEIDLELLKPLWRIGAQGRVNQLHLMMLDAVAQAYGRSNAQLTGTDHGRDYRYETEHTEGCAIDVATASTTLTKAQALEGSKRIAQILSGVDWRIRVVLYQDHRKKPDHLHIAVRCFEDWGRRMVRERWGVSGVDTEQQWREHIVATRWSLNGGDR